MNTNITNWKDRLSKLGNGCYWDFNGVGGGVEMLEDFISNLLKEQLEKAVMETEVKKGLECFKICREEIDKAVTEILDRVEKEVIGLNFEDNPSRGSSIDYNFDVEIKNQLLAEQRQKLTQLRQSNNLLVEEKL